MRLYRRFACLLLPALFLLSRSASGQFTSAVEGTVLDATRSAVPNASVILTNDATGVAYRSLSNNTGVFRVTTLPLGSYGVRVEAPGFKPWVQTGLQLEAGQVRTLNVTLEIGATQESVEVVASVTAVETGKSATGTEVSTTTIDQAPLLSRNIFPGLVAIVPGLTGTGTRTTDNFSPEAGYGIS